MLYRWPMKDLTYTLLDLWEAEPPEKRWFAIWYEIHGGEFKASFIYPEEVDSEEYGIERRERLLARRHGNKRIEYPLLPSEMRKARNGI